MNDQYGHLNDRKIVFIFERERVHLISIKNNRHTYSNMLYCILIISILAILPHMSARFHIDSKAPALVYYKRTRRIEKNFTKKYFLEFTQVGQSRCRIELKTNK